MNQQNDNKILGEQGAFDGQILERIAHGHVPDLRHPQRNEWFYNNVWRDPEYVKMSFLENIHFLKKHLKNNSRILEIGCGPGHNSLELARHGYQVTGIDLSPKCIEVAKKTLSQNKYLDGFGSLNYHAGDFLKMDIKSSSFDAILFYGALSHFPDMDSVLDRVCQLLVTEGRILIWDTSVDLYTEKDAAVLYLMRTLLAATGHYYQKQELAQNGSQLEEQLGHVLKELQYLDDKGLKIQSPNDNSQTLQTMCAALEKKFDQIVFKWDSCFFRNMIGGIRSQKTEDEHALARFIKPMENYFIEQKILTPTFFYYVGERTSQS